MGPIKKIFITSVAASLIYIGGCKIQKDDYFSIDLHVHSIELYEEEGSIERVIESMEKSDLEAFAHLNKGLKDSWFTLVKEAEEYDRRENKKYEVTEISNSILTFENKSENKSEKRYYHIFNGEEVNCYGIDFVRIGGKRTANPEERTIEEILEEACEREILMINTLYVDNDNPEKTIEEEKEQYLISILKRNGNKIDAIDWDSYCIPWIRKALGGEDVNQLAIELSEKINIPIVAVSDLHMKYIWMVRYIGESAYIKIPSEKVDITDGRTIIRSIKTAIGNGDYENNFEYASFINWFFGFGKDAALRKLQNNRRKLYKGN